MEKPSSENISSAEKREGGERKGRGDRRDMNSLFCTVPRRQDQVRPAQTLLAI